MNISRVAMLSVHTCPLATLGGKKTGGMNVYVRDFSRELARNGVEVDVFTRSEDDCQPMVRHDLGNGARVVHIPAGPEKPLPIPSISGYLDDFARGLLSFVESEGVEYDLIHSHYWLSGLVAEIVGPKLGNPPVIQMFHTLGHMKNRIAETDADRAPDERIAGEREVLITADRIIAATQAEYAQLHWLYAADMEKVRVIPPGVDLERFSPIDKATAKAKVGIEAGHRNILFAGRIEPLKGIDTLLCAMSLIQEHSPEAVQNVSVAIVGGDPWSDDPGQEMARLQELRGSLGVTDIVTFLGAKDQDVLPDYYAAAEMVVMPSHYESFGLVALEAMAMGVPVIASEVGGLAFLVKDGVNGFLVPSRDPEALAERIYTLLMDDECRRRLGESALNYAQKYAWPNIVERMQAVYADLLGQELGKSNVPAEWS